MRWLLLVLLFGVAGPAMAEQRYVGEQTIWEDTVWEGDILIDGILTVAAEVRLEIRPGTTVRFTRFDSNNDGFGEHEIFIQGQLLALGTADQPIRFTAADKNAFPGYWGAINMMGSEEDNQLRHCIIEYAYRGFHAHFGKGSVEDSLFRRNLRAFQFQDSTVSVLRSRVEDNFNGLQFRDSTVTMQDCRVTGGQWGLRGVYSHLDIRNCLIERNRVNGISLRDSTLAAHANLVQNNRRGVYLQRSQGEIIGNQILNNAEHGTFFEDSTTTLTGNRIERNGRAGIRWLHSGGIIRDNSLAGNGEYAVINDGVDPLTATGNWWGTADPETISTMVRDSADRPQTGPVITAEPLSAPPVLTIDPAWSLPQFKEVMN
jgi:parallel beta-helix repeat protein